MAKAKRDVYQDVTDKIIAALKSGTKPWSRPWSSTGISSNIPLRHNGKPYQGINTLLLWAEGRSNPFWMTYKQAQEYKGERGTMVTFFKPLGITDKETGEEKTIPLLRHYTVFNAEQIEGLPERFYPQAKKVAVHERNAACDAFIEGTGAEFVEYDGTQAYYAPGPDHIRIPKLESFKEAVRFYSVAFHELTHWTGAKSRLDRLTQDAFGSKDYAFEELVAELGAAFLCAEHGLDDEPRDDHADYLAGWLTKMESDKKFIFKAAAKAQKAVTFLHNLQPVTEAEAA